MEITNLELKIINVSLKNYIQLLDQYRRYDDKIMDVTILKNKIEKAIINKDKELINSDYNWNIDVDLKSHTCTGNFRIASKKEYEDLKDYMNIISECFQ